MLLKEVLKFLMICDIYDLFREAERNNITFYWILTYEMHIIVEIYGNKTSVKQYSDVSFDEIGRKELQWKYWIIGIE